MNNLVYRYLYNLSNIFLILYYFFNSKGSVLVDYFVELKNLPEDLNTLQIKKLFHDAIMETPPKVAVIPLNDFDDFNEDNNNETNSTITKNRIILGRFAIDPISTDFIVIPKQIIPTIMLAEQNSFIPQWAIAVAVIGMASLMFVIVFGVAVVSSFFFFF